MKTIGSRVLTAGVVLAVATAGLAWWRVGPETQGEILRTVGRMAGWFGLVLSLPWATFFLTLWAARADTNAAGAALVVGYTALEVLLLGWLLGFSIGGAGGWVAFTAAVLLAGLYNLLACDWIAERLEA
jgi:FtsH-binding integral membrane protein